MSKISIVDLNPDDKDQTRNYMVKGEPGNDGVSPTVDFSVDGDVVTLTITDADGEHSAELNKGVSPTVTTSKVGSVTIITITDVDGTHTATINDGEDLTEQFGLTVNSFDESVDYDTYDTVIYNDKIYIFITDHSAGAWNDEEVELLPVFYVNTPHEVILNPSLIPSDNIFMTSSSNREDASYSCSYLNDQFSKIVVINEAVTIPANETSVEHYINFPTGFNKTNCVILSAMVDNGLTGNNVVWTPVYNFYLVGGSIVTPSYGIELGDTFGENPDGITLTIERTTAPSSDVTRNFKIVLMKTS